MNTKENKLISWRCKETSRDI